MIFAPIALILQLVAGTYLVAGKMTGEVCVDLGGIFGGGGSTGSSSSSSSSSSSTCSCPSSWLSDGTCDSSCNNAACNYDAGDCSGTSAPPPPSPSPPSSSTCSCPSSWLSDGMCDSSCNNAACNYDAGDCSGSGMGRRLLAPTLGSNPGTWVDAAKVQTLSKAKAVHAKAIQPNANLTVPRLAPRAPRRLQSTSVCVDVDNVQGSDGITMLDLTFGPDLDGPVMTCLVGFACAIVAALLLLIGSSCACCCKKYSALVCCTGVALIFHCGYYVYMVPSKAKTSGVEMEVKPGFSWGSGANVGCMIFIVVTLVCAVSAMRGAKATGTATSV